MFSLLFLALQHAGKHMEDSIVASYTALLLGCLCQGSPVSTFNTTTTAYTTLTTMKTSVSVVLVPYTLPLLCNYYCTFYTYYICSLFVHLIYPAFTVIPQYFIHLYV